MDQNTDHEKIYKLTGYSFKNRGLLMTALTHSSYASEHKLGYERNNERLEFIGDAYVDAVVGAELFAIMGKAREGVLSRCRADIVCEDSLADTALKMGLGELLYLGNKPFRRSVLLLYDYRCTGFSEHHCVMVLVISGNYRRGYQYRSPACRLKLRES